MTAINVSPIVECLKNKDPGAALRLLNLLPDPDQNTLAVMYLKGISLYLNAQHNQSKDNFLQILKENPNHLPSILGLAKCFFALNKHGASIACLSKAIKMTPENIDFYKSIINIYEASIKYNNQSFLIPIEANIEKMKVSKENTIIILCGGEATRWKSHLGIKHKHLINIEGEILLDRTLRQLSRFDVSTIIVLVRPGDVRFFEEICRGRAAVREITLPRGGETPAWKYLSSEHYWSKSGNTISLLGDVWFSDNAIETIFKDYHQSWLAFGRKSASSITGCPYGEIFAHKFTDYKTHLDSLLLLNQLYFSKLCTAHASGWALSQLMSNENPNSRSNGKNFVEINDFTEDFDFPEDYERWIRKRSQINRP
jgi:tetratricopeptide (TPR) repeat protein